MFFDHLVRIIVLLAVVLVLLTIFVWPSRAHEAPSGKWEYDKDCCHDQDCAPITNIEQSGSGLQTITTITNKLGLKGIITPRTSFRLSKDKEEHACILKYAQIVICYYGVEKF